MRLDNRCCLNQLAGHSNKTASKFLYFVVFLLTIPALYKIVDSPSLFRCVDIKTGNLDKLRQNVYFNHIHEENFSRIEKDFDGEDRAEFLVEVNFVVMQKSMYFFKGFNDPCPKLKKMYMFIYLYLARKGLILILIFAA